MEEILIKEINKNKFDAYVLTSRSTTLDFIGKELFWFSNEDETILGTIVLDKIDNDYAAIMLGRDEIGRFRAFNLETCFPNVTAAINWLKNTMKWYTGLGKKVFPQGDPSKVYKLFDTILPLDKQHPFFIRLNSDDAYFPAKSIINQIMPYFIDIDGNFIEQFQSTGFDSRIWELYLYSYFIEEKFEFNRKHNRPDFIIKKNNASIAVEAVIVGRKDSKPKYINLDPNYFREKFKKAMDKNQRDRMAIKFGSPLFTKLKKKYWNLKHIKNMPFIIAIADFHDDYSMIWSHNYLITYLYGYDFDYYYNKDNKLIINPIKIDKHKYNEKEIPSGFFNLPEAQNISGILFTASGTISKFNRMGIQAGFKKKNIKVIRYGFNHNHDPNASVANFFKYEVNEDSKETWSEGLNLYHNPRAKIPIDPELFPSIAHHFLDKTGNIVSYLPDFHPYSSITIHFRIKE